jgi:hypothetical protein
MTAWRRTHEVLDRRASQIALRLRDEFTGAAPIGRWRVTLEARDPSGAWHATGRRPTLSTSQVVTYPGLERRARAAGLPARSYRVLLDAAYYFALYASPASQGVEIAVQPFDEQNPAPLLAAPTDLLLLPAPTYPFPSHVRVLRGRVRVQGTNDYVAGALVSEGTRERVLTDANGAFALPLRWPPADAAGLAIDADDRAGRTGGILVTLPAALEQSHTIEVH